MSVEREAEGGGIERDEGVPDRLIHVAVEVLVLIFGGRGGGGGGRRGIEICEGDDLVAICEAVEEGEEGIFTTGDEADDLEGWAHFGELMGRVEGG